jgi:hypothetical protein
MPNLICNTLQFDSQRRADAADQAILMPTGSIPVILVFGESISMGAQSTVADAQLDSSTRVFDEPYRGRSKGFHWNNWITTPDAGVNFDGSDRAGLAVSSPGTAFEESISKGGGVSLGAGQLYTGLAYVNPVWGLLDSLYGLFRDESTNEIILPRVIQVGRTASWAHAGDASITNNVILSWAPEHDGLAGSYRSCYESMVDSLTAAQTSLAGTPSYLMGAFTTLGQSDTSTVYNAGGANAWDNMAVELGDSLQAIRDALESEFSIDPFPFVATQPRIVVDTNDRATLKDSRASMKAWASSYEMTLLADLMDLQHRPGAYPSGDQTNPHTDGRGAFEMGRMWGQTLRNAFASTGTVYTAPKFSV